RSYGDWSSDVCSSDLHTGRRITARTHRTAVHDISGTPGPVQPLGPLTTPAFAVTNALETTPTLGNAWFQIAIRAGAFDRCPEPKIGRASCRESVENRE